MERVVSGIRPTGRLHLGNYFGAMVNFVKMQETNDCMFLLQTYILSQHIKSVDCGNVRQTLIEYLASGLDPEKAVIYVQSDVPEHIAIFVTKYDCISEGLIVPPVLRIK